MSGKSDLGAIADAVGAVANLGSGITEQIGSGIREWKAHEYKLEEMLQDTEDQIKIMKEKSELTKAEAEKLLDLELKKLKVENELYEMRSNIDINKAREMAKIEMQQKEKDTDQELRLLNTRYSGDADLLKLKSNQILNQQQYQPTIMPNPYGYYNYNFGMYGPTNTPQTGLNQVKKKNIHAYKKGLSGHRIEQY